MRRASEDSPFALPSCRLAGVLDASAALALLRALPERAPVLLELVGLALNSNDELEAFAKGFGAPLIVLCRGEVSGSAKRNATEFAAEVLKLQSRINNA